MRILTWDVFISYASEDKEVAKTIAKTLRERRIKVWYDDFELKMGDSLSRSIDKGLAKSKYGIVILSPDFFGKKWPQRELKGLVAKEMGEDQEKVILPVWHNIDAEDVRKYSPPLADKLAVSTSEGIQHVISEIIKVLEDEFDTKVSTTGSLDVSLQHRPIKPRKEDSKKSLFQKFKWQRKEKDNAREIRLQRRDIEKFLKNLLGGLFICSLLSIFFSDVNIPWLQDMASFFSILSFYLLFFLPFGLAFESYLLYRKKESISTFLLVTFFAIVTLLTVFSAFFRLHGQEKTFLATIRYYGYPNKWLYVNTSFWLDIGVVSFEHLLLNFFFFSRWTLIGSIILGGLFFLLKYRGEISKKLKDLVKHLKNLRGKG